MSAGAERLPEGGPFDGAAGPFLARLASHGSRPVLGDLEELGELFGAHTALGDLVVEALERARTVFGDEATLALEPFRDPEASPGTRRAFLVIRTSLDVDSGNRRMHELDDWWLDNSHRASGLLSMTIEYA